MQCHVVNQAYKLHSYIGETSSDDLSKVVNSLMSIKSSTSCENQPLTEHWVESCPT